MAKIQAPVEVHTQGKQTDQNPGAPGLSTIKLKQTNKKVKIPQLKYNNTVNNKQHNQI